MLSKVYDKYISDNTLHYIKNIYDGNNVQIDEMKAHEDASNEAICIRVSLFKDNHWQGDCELLPQIRSLTFEKKYNKIKKQNYFDWFSVKEYNDFSIYLSQNEKYIMICNEIDGSVMYTSVYNIEEITE